MCDDRYNAPDEHSHCGAIVLHGRSAGRMMRVHTEALLPSSMSLVGTFEQAEGVVYSKVCGLVFRETASGTQSLFGDASTVSYELRRRANTFWGRWCARWELLPVSDATRRYDVGVKAWC
jgi:hypothetical protein